MTVMICPHCASKASRVLYAGFPMWLCEECSTVCGFWSFILSWHFDGCFMAYDGSYLRALWAYLRGEV